MFNVSYSFSFVESACTDNDGPSYPRVKGLHHCERAWLPVDSLLCRQYRTNGQRECTNVTWVMRVCSTGCVRDVVSFCLPWREHMFNGTGSTGREKMFKSGSTGF